MPTSLLTKRSGRIPRENSGPSLKPLHAALPKQGSARQGHAGNRGLLKDGQAASNMRGEWEKPIFQHQKPPLPSTGRWGNALPQTSRRVTQALWSTRAAVPGPKTHPTQDLFPTVAKSHGKRMKTRSIKRYSPTIRYQPPAFLHHQEVPCQVLFVVISPWLMLLPRSPWGKFSVGFPSLITAPRFEAKHNHACKSGLMSLVLVRLGLIKHLLSICGTMPQCLGVGFPQIMTLFPSDSQ